VESDTVVLVRQAGLGMVETGDREFGLQMFDRFLHALETQPNKPRAICFYTEGVKLICEGSPVVPALRLIEAMGIRLAVCTSCLEYYGLRQKLAAGQACGMNDILKLLMDAGKVISV
jgi:hypothetical protein